MNFNIDVIIFLSFLLVNLIVGLNYGRGVETIKDYALGGRNFSTGALVSTIVATWISGSGFFITLSNTYTEGLYYLIASCSMALSLIITAYFLVPRMTEFMGKTSIAEAMGDLYGKEIRLITAICGILGNVGGIAVQFKVFGTVFDYFLGIESTYAIILASTIVILYSAFGGIRAVTYTDILQFITFGFAVPMIGIIIWNHVYDAGLPILEAMQNPIFDYKKVLDFGNPKFWQMIPLIIYFAVPTIDSMDFQRISMGRNIRQVKRALIISAFFLIIVELITGWIPFLIQIINPNIQANQLINFIVENYTYTGLKGLMMIGIAAMAMSTADSRINSASVLFGNDVCKLLNIKTNHLFLSKIFSLVLGVFAIYLALLKADLLNIIMTSASLYMPIVTVPLLLAILGFRSTKISVLIGMVAGFSIVIVWNIFDVQADGIVWGMAANLVCFLGSHYLLRQTGGWKQIKDRTYLDEVKWQRKRQFSSIIEFFSVEKFIKFCKKTAPKNEIMYTWLGMYFIFLTFSTMYSTQVALLQDRGRIILVVYQIMMCTGTAIAMYPIWPTRIKHEIIMQVAWNIVIFYMLIFFSCFFVMLSDFGQLQFAIFTMNILITGILVGWRLSLMMMLIGFYLSIQFYKFYMGVNELDFSIGSPQFIFVYSLMLVGSSLLIFLKPKQEQQELMEEKNEHLNGRMSIQEIELKGALALKKVFIRNVNHEYRTPISGITILAQTLFESYDKLTDKQCLLAIESIYKSSLRFEKFDDNIVNLSKLSKPEYKLEKKQVNFSQLIYERIQICKKLYEENEQDREFIFDIENDLTIKGDKYYLIQVIDNLTINAISYCKKGKIIITLKANNSELLFSISDEGIGIPVAELNEIFGEFIVSSKTHTPAGGRGIGLALCKRVIDLHSGKIWAECNEINGAVFKIVLPLIVK